MTIMVTGAAGFLGLNLLEHLVSTQANAKIIAVDLPTAGDELRGNLSRGALAQVVFAALDVRDQAACRALLARLQPSHLLHGAAITDGPEELMRAVNCDGTSNLLEAAMAAGSVERCVLLSSSGLYDQGEGSSACDEGNPLDLSTPYARSKRDAELLVETCGCASRMEVTAARIGPVYGPKEQSRTYRPRVSLVQVLLQALRAKRVLTIAGDDMQRDWTHSADVARALCGLLHAPTLQHRLYNVGAGKSKSARAIIQTFVEEGLRVCWTNEPARADVILNRWESRRPLCCARLAHDTGFAANIDIRTGISSLIHS